MSFEEPKARSPTLGEWLREFATRLARLLGFCKTDRVLASAAATTAPVLLKPGSTGSITDPAGDLWTLSADGVVHKNGVAVAGGSHTAALTLVTGLLWAQGSGTGEWYIYRNGFWYGQGATTPGTNTPPIRIAPGRVLGLHSVAVTQTTIRLAWTPATGSQPMSYAVLIRVHGTFGWSVGANTKTNSAIVPGLKPSTTYDIEILAHNT